MKHLLRPLPVVLLSLMTGCQSLQYLSTSPNVRSFSEDPSLSQSYIGFDMEFAVTDPPTDADGPDANQSAALPSPQEPEDPDIIPQPFPEPKYLPW
jgi:hypothetical protein